MKTAGQFDEGPCCHYCGARSGECKALITAWDSIRLCDGCVELWYVVVRIRVAQAEWERLHGFAP